VHAREHILVSSPLLNWLLCLLTRQAREKDYNWGTLGWILNIPKDKSQGRRSFVDSGHTDSTRFCAQLSHDEGLIGIEGNIHPSQDPHTMISHVLKGLVQLQKTGIKWELMHRIKLYKDITMIPYVSYLRVGIKEADLFCGKHTNRNKHVKQLCRECYCPTDKTDNHLANCKAKTQHQIATLVLRKDKKWLQLMSQQCIKNAFYDGQFGCHNKMGIHGACPMEMLHALLLGVFKYDSSWCLNNTLKMPSTMVNLAVTTKWASAVHVQSRCCTLCYLMFSSMTPADVSTMH